MTTINGSRANQRSCSTLFPFGLDKNDRSWLCRSVQARSMQLQISKSVWTLLWTTLDLSKKISNPKLLLRKFYSSRKIIYKWNSINLRLVISASKSTLSDGISPTKKKIKQQWNCSTMESRWTKSFIFSMNASFDQYLSTPHT